MLSSFPRSLVGIVALAVVFTGLLYVYRRIVRDVWPRLWHQILAAVVFVSLTVGSAVLVVKARLSGDVFLGGLSFLWAGFLLHVIMVLAFIDAGKIVQSRFAKPSEPDPKRRHFLRKAVAATAASTGAALTGLGTYRAYSPAQAHDVPLRLQGLPRTLDGLSIVQLTDVHVGAMLQDRYLGDLVERANALSPDVLVITGDLVDGTVGRLGSIVAKLQGLRARYGTYFVTGNHDYYSGADMWCTSLTGLGLNVLRNRSVLIGNGNDAFNLAGVDDWGSPWLGEREYDLNAALKDCRPEVPTVLLAHQPSNFDEVARRGVALQLSGHTHGGQTFPATLIAGGLWGDRSVGLSKTAESMLYVSRGCGFVGPPLRLGSPPELPRFILSPA